MDVDRTWFATFVAVVFLAGLSTGVLLDPGPAPGDSRGRRGAAQNGGRAADVLSSRIADGLSLSQDQRERLTSLMEQRDQQLRAVRRDATARLDAELQRVREEILRILTPEQQEHFDDIVGGGLRDLGRSGRTSRPRATPESIQGP